MSHGNEHAAEPQAPVSHVGIIDWGIGGLDFARRLQNAHPELALSYISDSGFTPYGKVPAPQLRSRLQVLARHLGRSGAGAVVLACNAASSVLPLGERGIVVGVIEPTLAELRGHLAGPIAVLGGQQTIACGVYEKPLRALGASVRCVVAQPLSALVEAGEVRGPRVDAAVAIVADGLAGTHTLVPACTHYAALLPLLIRAISPKHIVDPAQCTLAYLTQHFRFQAHPTSSGRSMQVWTTGSRQGMTEAAKAAFNIELDDVRALDDTKL